MLTCNAFADNTIGSTQQIAGCNAPQLANIGEHELLPEQFLLLVLDGLLRVSPGIVAPLQAAPACDLAEALRNASCSMLGTTPQFGATPAQMQAMILYALNEMICA